MTGDGQQVALFGAAEVDRTRGPSELQTRRAVEAAGLEARHAGAAAVLCDVAWAIDAARAAGKFYGVAQAAPAYTELARALGMTVEDAKGGPADDVEGWLRGLTDPTMGNPAQP